MMEDKRIIVIMNLVGGSKAMEVYNYSNANVKLAIALLLEISAADIKLCSSSMSGSIYQVTKEYRGLKDDIQDIGLGRYMLKVEFTPLSPAPEYIPTKFILAGEGKAYEGIYNPFLEWNGYAVPFFTQEIADEILRGTAWDYTFDRLKFILKEEDAEDTVYEAVNLNGKHMYAIGGYCWCWDVAEDDEEEDEQEYINYYECPKCGNTWDEVWTCGCDSECPKCDTRNISPYNSEEV